MKGAVIRHGKKSWRLKFDIGRDANGKRQIRYETLRGTRKDAEAVLTKALSAFHGGTLVEPSKVTVGEYLRGRLETSPVLTARGTPMAGKTVEQYRQLAEQQINPHLGATKFQKLRPDQIQKWHTALLNSGGNDGTPLSARTVGGTHTASYTPRWRVQRKLRSSPGTLLVC